MRPFCLFLCGIAISAPAMAGFDVVDFKYNSLTHIGFEQSVVQTTAAPAEVADLIASFLRASGASITSLDESSIRLVQTQADAECERWSRSIFEAEFAAFNANSVKQYKKIDRSTQPASCFAPNKNWLQYGYSVDRLVSGGGYRITATVDRSVNISQRVMRPTFSTIFSGYSSANIWGLVPSNVQTNMAFQTYFEVILWRGANESKTSVFVVASPISSGVAPGPGNRIGASLRALADGKIEAAAARNLLTYVVQKSLVAPSSAVGGR